MDDAKLRARSTYDAAAEFFDSLGFWNRFGQATVDRVDLRPGYAVLDVCAGAGASAIAAARRVAPTGRVVAVDLADNLLAVARTKAEEAEIAGIFETRCEDLEELTFPPDVFDAVLVVFGVFFLPDMVAAMARLWELVAPGGQLAITTWGPGLFEPASSMFWNAVGELRPELYRAYNPWDSLTDPATVAELLADAGVGEAHIEAVDGTHPLASPEEFWTIVLGTGYRATTDALAPAERDAVRQRVVAELRESHVTEIHTNVIYAVATKGNRGDR
jgi:ubiquinone/menaquinone biosynthesis C-methylase UbiE